MGYCSSGGVRSIPVFYSARLSLISLQEAISYSYAVVGANSGAVTKVSYYVTVVTAVHLSLNLQL